MGKAMSTETERLEFGCRARFQTGRLWELAGAGGRLWRGNEIVLDATNDNGPPSNLCIAAGERTYPLHIGASMCVSQLSSQQYATLYVRLLGYA